MEKKCSKCKEIKDTSLFYKNGDSSDGFHSWCRECVRIKNKLKYDPVYYRNYYKKNQERIDKYHNEFYDKNKDMIAKRCRGYYQINKKHINSQTKLWQQENPEKCKAHTQTFMAINRGELTRSETCECCEKVIKTEFHHYDYSKPLDVLNLCRSCHRVYHRGNNCDHNLKIDNLIYKKFKSDIKIE